MLSIYIVALGRNELDRFVQDLKGIEQGVTLLQRVVVAADHIAAFAGLSTACFALCRQFSNSKQGLLLAAAINAKLSKPRG